MKYAKEAKEAFFFDFVFYEVENKTMYVYCPNCGCEHEIDLKKKSVQDIKKLHKPCSCFDKVPHYYHTRHNLNGLNRSKFVAEFARWGDDVEIKVYSITVKFGAENYNTEGYAFRRYPVFDWKCVSRFTFMENGKVDISTNMAKWMGNYSIQTYSRKTQNWAIAMADASIIRESTEELKGTFMERWIPELYKINDAYCAKTNLEWNDVWDAFVVGVLIDLHHNEAYRRMWKAGFTSLCLNKTLRLSVFRQWFYREHNLGHLKDQKVINWNAKRLDKALKVDINLIDNILERDRAEVNDVIAIKEMVDCKIPITGANHDIFMQDYMPELRKMCDEQKLALAPIVKYIRKNEAHVVDYYDYIKNTIELKIALTREVVFPKNFWQAHDRQAALYEASKKDKQRRGFVTAVRKYFDADYKDDQYVVSVIKSVDQLKRWGQKMHNCSGGYVNRVITNQSVIFTVCESAHPRTAFCMLEFSPTGKNIVQLRGVNNRRCSEEVQQWVNLWMTNILLPLLLKQTKRKKKKVSA